MVRVGFIVEGDCEKIVVESSVFRQFLQENGCQLVTPVVDAKGGGNLLPQNIDVFISVLESNGVDKIYVLTDLEDEPSVAVVKSRIQHAKVETVFVAVKALEAWFLADSPAMSKWLGIDLSEAYPEVTINKPWDRLKEVSKELGKPGPGSKPAFAKKMTKYFGFSVGQAATHPNCPSARELIDFFKAAYHE